MKLIAGKAIQPWDGLLIAVLLRGGGSLQRGATNGCSWYNLSVYLFFLSNSFGCTNDGIHYMNVFCYAWI